MDVRVTNQQSKNQVQKYIAFCDESEEHVEPRKVYRFKLQNEQNTKLLIRIFSAENICQGKGESVVHQKISVVVDDQLPHLFNPRV